MRLKYILAVAAVIVCAAAVYLLKNPYPGRFSLAREKAVYIRYQDGGYTLYRFGKPFFVNGAAGTTHLAELHAAGGNTVRTWDTVGLDRLLTDAEKNDISVIVGLPMPYNDDMDAFYNNQAKVDALFKRYQAVVAHYKGRKGILCWCLGNELAFPAKPQYNRFYTAFNRLVDMIHHDDPDHPVTTTVINFLQKNVFCIKLRTDIDFISFNIFGALRHLDADLKKFKLLWNGPFLITEWGIDGPWPGHEQTAWGAFIEATSNKKAEQYRDLYEHYMPLKNPHLLGSLVFFWGQKQETTPTWFSMFDAYGNKSASVDVMQSLWTGKPLVSHAPMIDYMLVDNKGAKDNLIYNPGVSIKARLLMADTARNKNLRFEWYMQTEDWFRTLHVYNQKAKRSLTDLLLSANGPDATFRTPEREGPYRIFVNVYDDKGYFATCNTPIYVVEDK